MDYRLEAVHEVMFAMWASRSKATRSFERGAQGEMFVLRELAFQGPRTPSQLAEAMGATSGRISTILSGLDRKGWVVRTAAPDDRRSVVVALSDEGRRVFREHGDELIDRLAWVFTQMGETRTRDFTALLSEFMTYLSICEPDAPAPTEEQVRAAFSRSHRLHERMLEMAREGGACAMDPSRHPLFAAGTHGSADD
ncbi:MarR family transcriptional regulator [Bifidobacterium pseudolongum subsp. globosum]|uniref:MarR family transcriptional regulator n=1 Tax=Bifidobacterium pseudolongum subsp. globosum TaxID=1690 RepID=A0A4Q5A264_9BIFI|nr:MarR family transcriptional regulator [Bifidobacterium pseudolongum]RYQ12051.1 MarR family transcriptional regulator [Bifidobacterium pseudolongum subsp. globosum]